MLRAMNARIYIDGQAGTTGLEIRQRLASRPDLTLLEIEESRRKDPALRAELLRSADVAVLCLPDAASKEAVELAAGSSVRLLDASTAHRVAAGWVYGLPELDSEQRSRIRHAARVSNPGCYPTGVVLLLNPLVQQGLLPPEAPIAVHALSGYSGGGRQLIERWEDASTGLAALRYEAPYALGREHKHLAEMARYAGLAHPPHFVPAVGPFRSGMRIEISLHRSVFRGGVGSQQVHEALSARYRSEPFVRVRKVTDEETNELTYDPCRYNGTNEIELSVVDNAVGHVLLVAVLDNLGKGAAGAAIQNLNLMLGADEASGLAPTTKLS